MVEYIKVKQEEGVAMRKKDREVTDLDEMVAIMQKCDVCRLALNDNSYPYILPLNFGIDVVDGVVKLFFHSAMEGYKLQLLKKDNRASFEMDCRHEVQYFAEKGYCTFVYESVIGHGRVKILAGEEKLHALQKLMDHYHEKGAYFNPAAVPRTAVYALTVEHMTGKRK